MCNIFINDMGYSEYYKKEETKMNLAKKYKQLFEGKTRSNDSKLLKEFQYEKDWEDVIDMDSLDFETLVAAEDGAEVQIPIYHGEVGGGFRKDTEMAGEDLPEFLTAIIDKSDPDFYAFEFDKESAAALDASDVYGGAEQVAAELEGWTEGELEDYEPTGSSPAGPLKFDKEFIKHLETIAKGAKAGKDMSVYIMDNLFTMKNDFHDRVWDEEEKGNKELGEAYDDLNFTVIEGPEGWVANVPNAMNLTQYDAVTNLLKVLKK